MVIQGCPWIITCNNFRQWTPINQTNWCYSATLTVAIFNLLCRLQTGLRTFKFIEAGNSHQQRHHFGDSSLECWSQSVSQCPLITSSCLPVNMESTNSLIFEDNNFKNSFMGAAFGASYKAIYIVCASKYAFSMHLTRRHFCCRKQRMNCDNENDSEKKVHNGYYCDDYIVATKKQRNEEWELLLRRARGRGIVRHALIAQSGIRPSLGQIRCKHKYKCSSKHIYEYKCQCKYNTNTNKIRN